MSTDPSVWDEIRRCEEQYERNPESLVFARLADAYRKAGEIDLALKVVEDGISRHPDYLSGHIVLGRCHRDLKQNTDAIAAFERVAELDASNLVAVRSLAELSAETGDTEAAREWYTRLTHLDPVNDEAVRVLRELGGPIESVEDDGDDGAGSGAEPSLEVPEAAAFQGSSSLDEPETLAGKSPWPADLSDTPDPIDPGNAIGEMELTETESVVEEGELLDWPTSDIVDAGEEATELSTPSLDQDGEETAPPGEAEPIADDLWLAELETGISGNEESPADAATVHPDPLAVSEAPAEEESHDDWFSAPGPLDEIEPSASPDSVEELEPRFDSEVEPPDDLASTALGGADTMWAMDEPEEISPDPIAELESAGDAGPIEETDPVVEPEPMAGIESVFETGSIAKIESADESEPSDEVESKMDSEPEVDADAPSPAPWWEELAQAGLNVGADADIESLVDRVPAVPEEGTEVSETPMPGGSEDADIMTRTMADLYADQGLYEEAIEIYEELLTDRPDDAEIRARLDNVLARSRREPAVAESEDSELPAAEPALHAYDPPDPQRGSAEEGDDTIPIAAYQQPENREAVDVPDDDAGPRIAEEFEAMLRAGERLAEQWGERDVVESSDWQDVDTSVPEIPAESGGDGILEGWLRRLKG